LHEPTIQLRSAGERSHSVQQLVRELFGIHEDGAAEQPRPQRHPSQQTDGADPDNVRQLPSRASRSRGA
jgi:hypothetical protein